MRIKKEDNIGYWSLKKERSNVFYIDINRLEWKTVIDIVFKRMLIKKQLLCSFSFIPTPSDRKDNVCISCSVWEIVGFQRATL